MQAKIYHHHGWQGQLGAPSQYLPVVFEVARLTQVLTHTIHPWYIYQLYKWSKEDLCSMLNSPICSMVLEYLPACFPITQK